MCRLLGILSAESIPYRVLLRETHRSLSTLSEEHPDGWGLAVFSSRPNAGGATTQGWELHKGIHCAQRDEAFHETSSKILGEVLVSHVRRATVGPVSPVNTHPFERQGWVFAHNGTIKDLDYLRRGISPAQSKTIRGETDSELFFAFLLSRFEEKGLLKGSDDGAIDTVLKSVTHEVILRPNFGELSFLLSNGATLYAYRWGAKPLFLLERGPHHGPQYRPAIEGGRELQIPWTKRRHAFFLASEKMTQEPWVELKEGELLRIDRHPQPTLRYL